MKNYSKNIFYERLLKRGRRVRFVNIFTIIAIFLLCFTKSNISAQTYRIELWLKADNVRNGSILSDNANVARWDDCSSFPYYNFVQNGTQAVPVFSYEGMNYHPSLKFESSPKKLVSEVIFPSETGRIYRSFYVSRSNLTGSNLGAVFSYRDNNDEGWRGTISTNEYLYYYNGTVNNFNPGVNKRYGIVSVDRGISATSGGAMWHNSKPATSASRPLTGTPGKAIIGSRMAATSTSPFYGNIHEIIIISTTVSAFNQMDIDIITSYLAIKYGQALENSQPHLYNSKGAMVWNAFSNTGYNNNIFGIGRDDSTSLYQRQSISYEDNFLSIFMGNRLSNLNYNNDGTLENMSYLILGSNLMTGVSNYRHPENTVFANQTLTDEFFDKRQNRIYKAQVTGTDSLVVNLQLNRIKPKYVMVSDNENFIPSRTRIYPVNKYETVYNVEIRNGDYICFVLSEKTPGGVVTYDMDFWLKADEIQNGSIMSDNTLVSRWDDLSWSDNDFIGNGTNPTPIYKHNGMNFNPAVTFRKYTSTSQINCLKSEYRFQTESSADKIYRSFYVSAPSPDDLYSNSTNGAIFSYRDNLDEGWYGNTQNNYLYFSATSLDPGLRQKRYGITSMSRAGTIWHNARPSSGTARHISSGNDYALLGTRLSSPALASSFSGDIQEVIIISTPPNVPFNDMDIQKITSYLAIKYGQTLESNQPHLFSSLGDTVWSANRNAGYSNNVFGIANDYASGLHQKQSMNVDDNTLTIFLGNTLHSLNTHNRESLNRNTYLLLGSNAEIGTTDYAHSSNAFINPPLPAEKFIKRQKRVYKAQITGTFPNTVSFQIKNFRAKYVIVSDTANFAPARTRLYLINDGIAHGIQIKNGDYIGFVMSDVVPGGVEAYNVELWLKADDLQTGAQPANNTPIERWENHSGAMLDFVKNGKDGVPIYKIDGMNYHPAARFEISAKKLVSENNFQIEAGKVYRSFYVSKSELVQRNAITYGSVFAYRDNFEEGWRTRITDDLYLYYSNGTTASSYTSFDLGLSNKQFGITSMDRAGTVWHNARPSSSGTDRALTVGNTSKAIIGTRALSDTANPFFGDIQEIIILSRPNVPGGSFAQTDLAKINTYLAVKYGLMLDTLAHPQWISSNNTIIWNTADHRGYNHNIFGIGRDNSTGLYQKQSFSVGSSEKLTVFLGDMKPAKLNTQNNGTLNDGEFLMFGSNGVLSNNTNRIPYSYGSGAQFMNDTIKASIEFRHPTVLRAHTIGADSFYVNFYLGGLRAEYLLVSDNPNFLPHNTRLYNIDGNFVASNVWIRAGDYVCAAFQQKTPAGVAPSLRLWLKADEPSTLDIINSETQEWRDFSGNQDNVFYYYNPLYAIQKRPGFRTIDPDMNFHPAVDFRFTSGGDVREFLAAEKAPFSTANVKYHTIVVMARIRDITAYSSFSYFLGFGNTIAWSINCATPAFGFAVQSRRNVGRAYQSGSGDGAAFLATGNLFKEKATAVTMFIRHQTGDRTTATQAERNSSYFKFEADAHVDSISAATSTAARDFVMPINNVMNSKSMIGAASIASRAMVGSISEVIAYEKVLDPEEKDKVYSYLALKYGVTLDKLKSTTASPAPPNNTHINFDYFLSDNTIVWAGTSSQRHQKYHNNVAAIVRDDAAGLNNMQSHSTDIGSTILMGIGQRLGTSPMLTGLDNDKEVIIWGNNGETFTTEQYFPENHDACTKITSILKNRIWMVDVLTQEDYSVLIGAGDQGFDASDYRFPYSSSAWQVTLLIADSVEKIQRGEWDKAIQGVFVDGLHQFNFTFKKGQTYYFTFGGKPEGNGCEPCDVGNKLNIISFAPAIWKRGWTENTYNLNSSGFTGRVRFEIEKGGNFSRSTPLGNNDGSISLWRNGNARTTMTFTLDLDSAAMASFEIGKIDYTSGLYSAVKVYGLCDQGIVVPRLNYMSDVNRAAFTINQSTGSAAAKRLRVSASDNRGKMNVTFDDPIRKIVVEHTMTGNSSGSKNLIIGKISLNCPLPPPPVNEDGFSFVQSATPQEAPLCKEITYTFRIQNTNCENKNMNFVAPLPQGMKWRQSSLVIDSLNIENANINNYGQIDTLSISNLMIKGGTTLQFFAKAYFDVTAMAGNYTNSAEISYERIINNVTNQMTLSSCDRFSSGCEPTTVIALPQRGALPLEITRFSLDKDCYKPLDIVNVTVEMNNPNTFAISYSEFEVLYNEEFTYQAGSLSSTNINGIGVPDVYFDGEGFVVDGTGSGFTIQPGTSTISFSLKAPAVLTPDYNDDNTPRLDESGNPFYVPLGVVFQLNSLDEDDECAESAFRDAYGDALLPAMSEISIIGNKTIYVDGSLSLSRWLNGVWASSNPTVATVNQSQTSAIISGISPGKVVFYFTEDSTGCIVVTDTVTVLAGNPENPPVNVIDPNINCFEFMAKNIEFGIKEKFKTENGSPAPTKCVDGFSVPLVGDLNGDGKPEIVIMGVQNSFAEGALVNVRYVNIYNGQTGALMYQYDLSVNSTMGSPYHRAPSQIAIADLDNDGIGEIVLVTHNNGGTVRALKPVFNGTTITGMNIMWIAPVPYGAPLTANQNLFGYPHPYIADLNADGIPEIIIYNKIYNGQTGALLMSWQNEAPITLQKNSSIAVGVGGLTNVSSTAPTLKTNADNVRNAAMLGRRPGSGTLSDNFLAVPAIIDIDGCGHQEIITGNRIHKFNFVSLDDHTQNTYYTIEGPLLAEIKENPNNSKTTHYLSDGFTRVADIDGDGKLDVIVATFADAGSADLKMLIYVWDWETRTLKAASTIYSDGDYGSFGIPFIGDINGKLDGWDDSKADRTLKLPEICMIMGRPSINCNTVNGGRSGLQIHPSVPAGSALRTAVFPGTHRVLGLTYDARDTNIENRLKISWAMEHADYSHNTGMTLFDFDNNGTMDICYRDEQKLRVISPAKGNNNAGSEYVSLSETETTPGTSIMFATNVFSGTGFEYPVIADVNLDGSADILITQNALTPSVSAAAGYIRVFEHNGHKWSPCPPVWNQSMYDPTQIQEDLKISKRPQSILTPYTSNGDTIYPYNGSWIQLPIVKAQPGEEYIPIVRMPDAILDNMKVSIQSNASAQVTLTISNNGSASISASSPISFYNGGLIGNSLETSTFIGKQPLGIDIFPGETYTLNYTLSGNFINTLVWARIMADSVAFTAKGYEDCNLDNNTLSDIDCPYLNVATSIYPDTVICGANGYVRLSVTDISGNPFTFAHTPVFQWYKNGIAISGANEAVLHVYEGGKYNCFVKDSICVKMTDERTVTVEQNCYLVVYKCNLPNSNMSDDSLKNEPSAHIVRNNMFNPPSGMGFQGWNTLANGMGTHYKPGDIINLTDMLILYAEWDSSTHIWDWADLAAVNNNLDTNYKLMANLDENSGFYNTYIGGFGQNANDDSTGWRPIGGTAPFTGSFNGNGKYIKGLWINTTVSGYSINNVAGISSPYNAYGLFGTMNGAEIYDLHLIIDEAKGMKFNVKNNNYHSFVGGIAGVALNTDIQNINISGGDIVAKADVDNNNWRFFGGLAGYNINSTFGNCHTEVNISAFQEAGGLVGRLSYSQAIDNTGKKYPSITNSSAVGNLSYNAPDNPHTSPTNLNFGGLAGRITSNKANISKSYSSGDVNVNILAGNSIAQAAVAGFVSYIDLCDSVLITSCYSSGTVNLGVDINTGNALKIAAGGFIAAIEQNAANPIIENCYTTGHVNFEGELSSTASGNYAAAGGFIAGMLNANSTLTNCYSAGWVSSDVQTNNVTYGAGGFAGIISQGNKLSNCFFDKWTSGIDTAAGFAPNFPAYGITGLNTISMTSENQFGTWSVNTSSNDAAPWLIVDSLTYPFLYWQDQDVNSHQYNINDIVEKGNSLLPYTELPIPLAVEVGNNIVLTAYISNMVTAYYSDAIDATNLRVFSNTPEHIVIWGISPAHIIRPYPIKIYICVTQVNIYVNDSLSGCENSTLTPSGNFVDNQMFGNDLIYRWEYSTTGDINVESDWSPVSGSEGNSHIGNVTASFTIPSLSASDAGYYRLIVGTPKTIDLWDCRSASKVMVLTVNPSNIVSIKGSNSICTGNTTQLLPTTNGIWSSTNATVATVTNDGLVTGVNAGSAQFIFISSLTGCSDTTTQIMVEAFPKVDPITAKGSIVCVNSDIELNCNTLGGVWKLSNGNAQIIGNQTDNPIKIRGLAEGKLYISYTVGTGMCQSTSTFLLKVTPLSPPELKIGIQK